MTTDSEIIKTQTHMNDTTWLAELNEQQTKAVTFEPKPLLVLAGPGSGKTRILTHRVGWLIRQHNTPPDHILAVTFTNRAAEEMRQRLYAMLKEEARSVWIVTFHAAAVRILRRFGETIGIPPTFSILDDEAQKYLIGRLIWQTGLSRELYPVGRVAHSISQWKNNIVLGKETMSSSDPAVEELIRQYENSLQARHSLDFDDLIRYSVLLLRHHESIRQHFHNTLQHILVDEYQDINDGQYELLKLLAPLDSSITAVADGDQSIYGWRGSQPRLIQDFQERYRPTVIRLTLSYRCPPKILYGAQHLIARQHDQEAQRFLQSQVDHDTPIFHYIFDDIHQEQRWIVALIKKLVRDRGHKPGDIGILYRTHRLAPPIEQTLLQAGFKVHRLKKESFFDHSMASEIIRYLQMLRSLHEDNFRSAVNFPRRVIDELTMIQLQRIADTLGVSLIDVARQSQDFSELSPLTRHYLQRFTGLLASALPDLHQDAASAVQSLFTLFSRLRSPWRQADMALLEGFFAFTDYLIPAAEQLADAIEAQRALLIVHPDSIDGRAAGLILQRALHDYLQVDVPMQSLRALADGGEIAAGLPICLGPDVRVAVAEHTDELIYVWPPQSDADPYCLSIHAWRCAQLLLISYETLAQGRFAFYDIETTGISPHRDEIVEIAAAIYEAQTIKGEPYMQLIRPQRGYIPRAATKIHGISYKQVADAPTIIQALPDFLEYIDHDTLVGHNIYRFDNRFIDKAMGELYEGRGFTPYYIDTLLMARRLLPEQPRYTLEMLIRQLGLGDEVEHRAFSDIEQTAALFFELCERLLDEKERESLTELLPWVAAGMRDANISLADETASLWHAAARVVLAADDEDAWVQPFAGEQMMQVASWLQELRQLTLPADPEDDEWAALQETFMIHVESFQVYSPDPSLAAFLDYVAMLQSIDTFAHVHDPEAITMMTLHNAKGSEFPVVIIVGVEQDNLPLWRTQDDPEQLAEERRVFYVGITRAREAVYLFSTRDRHDRFKRSPSPFAFDIPQAYIRRFRINASGRVKEL